MHIAYIPSAGQGTDDHAKFLKFSESSQIIKIKNTMMNFFFLLPLSAFAVITPPNLPDGWTDLGVESVRMDEEVKFVISGKLKTNTASSQKLLRFLLLHCVLFVEWVRSLRRMLRL